MNFSASELVKRSASQLVYKEVKKLEWIATPRQWEGVKYSEEVVRKEEASSEKRGIVKVAEHLLFFCVDLVKDSLFAEIKMVDNQESYEEWYLESSIMQSVFYASLLKDLKTLDTPKFRKKEGFAQEITVIPEDFRYELWFGTEKFSILPSNVIKEHYLQKLEVVAYGVERKNYDNARIFDSNFKHKEFQIFKPTYKKLT